ncbi:hypothetical protein MKW92_022666 [Papaver armeniacum]|nr:hypothetical protein MKW92_022666 [Papaver armeniacum]
MILDSNFSVLREMMVQLDEDSVVIFYADHSKRGFFNNLIKYMISGPVVVMVLEKEDAVVDWRGLIGPTNASKAKVLQAWVFSCNSHFTSTWFAHYKILAHATVVSIYNKKFQVISSICALMLLYFLIIV